MKPLLIGEAPSKNQHPPTPVEGRIGRRLAAWAGLSFEEFLAHFARMNLLEVRQEVAGKGFCFDMAEARHRASQLQLVAHPLTILLGRRVAEAFGVNNEYFVEQQWGGAHIFVVPHPSGVNRWFNDPANRTRMEAFMRRIVSETRA